MASSVDPDQMLQLSTMFAGTLWMNINLSFITYFLCACMCWSCLPLIWVYTVCSSLSFQTLRWTRKLHHPCRIFSYIALPRISIYLLTLHLLNMTCPVLANHVDPDQLASSEANWSGSALFVIKYVNFYQKPGSSNLIGCKLEVGVAS